MAESTFGTPSTVAIVGAGLAGLRTAEGLRASGFTGRLVLIGAEPHLPYDRPPLSKSFLAAAGAQATPLRKPDDWAALDVDLRLGESVVALEDAGLRLRLASGRTASADAVVLATGAVPRQLPTGTNLSGVHVLRTLDDATALRSELRPGARIVVVGAGFIGCEIAATCRGLTFDVTLVDPLEAPLVRVLGPQVGQAVARMHADHGVNVVCGVGVAEIRGDQRVDSVVLSDGRELPADVVVVGIGVVPEVDWLAGSGVEVDNGVVCDAYLHTSLPAVWAVGDVARWPYSLSGRLVRLEHWTNAVDHAGVVAHNLMNPPDLRRVMDAVPYFWSDQYGVKLQSLGLPDSDATLTVVRGTLEQESGWVVLYSREGVFTGVVAASRARDVMRCRPWLTTATPVAAVVDALAPAEA